MYSVQRDFSYYVVDRREGKTTEMTREELVKWVAYLLNKSRVSTNSPFRDINFSGSDTVLVSKIIRTWRRRPRIIEGKIEYVECWGFEPVQTYEERPILVLDSTGKIVDIRDFFDEAEKIDPFLKKTDRRRTYAAGTKLLSHYWYGDEKECFRFRRGPVPHIHKYTGNYTPKTHRFQNYKNAEKLRPKNRVSWDDMWDFPYRHTDRSWKSSCKKRHQWEKHLK